MAVQGTVALHRMAGRHRLRLARVLRMSTGHVALQSVTVTAEEHAAMLRLLASR